MEITGNGMRFHVEEQGSGDPAVVLLHYWSGSSRTWRRVTTVLANRYRTVAFDHRGWPGSDPAGSGAPGGGYVLADIAAHAEATIRPLGLQRHVLVGHSTGGKVAPLLASRRPRRLAGLVLVASAPSTPFGA